MRKFDKSCIYCYRRLFNGIPCPSFHASGIENRIFATNFLSLVITLLSTKMAHVTVFFYQIPKMLSHFCKAASSTSGSSLV